MAERDCQVKCTNNGRCCKELGVPDGIYSYKNPDGEDIVMEIKDGVCGYLKDGKCSIYEKRPIPCREWYCKYCKYK